MGMCARLIGIGLFSQDVSEQLDYPASHFPKTRSGAPVITELFGIVEGSTASREFALTLGISDPWDFNQHKIDRARVDLRALRDFVTVMTDYEPDFRRFEILFQNGFTFFFMPNG